MDVVVTTSSQVWAVTDAPGRPTPAPAQGHSATGCWDLAVLSVAPSAYRHPDGIAVVPAAPLTI
jgi:hypothetical protein